MSDKITAQMLIDVLADIKRSDSPPTAYVILTERQAHGLQAHLLRITELEAKLEKVRGLPQYSAAEIGRHGGYIDTNWIRADELEAKLK